MDMKFLTNEYRFTFFETPGTTTLFIAQFTLETCPVFFSRSSKFFRFSSFLGPSSILRSSSYVGSSSVWCRLHFLDLFTFFRSFAPTLGGYMIQTYGFPSLGMLGVVCNLIVLLLLKFSPFKDEETESSWLIFSMHIFTSYYSN